MSYIFCILNFVPSLSVFPHRSGHFHEVPEYAKMCFLVYLIVNIERFSVVGTNRGVMLLNMETGISSWVLRCKSDALSLQFKQAVSFI